MLVLGVWLGSLLWWLTLTFGLGSMFRSFEARHLKWINRVSGIILLLSGAGLLTAPLIARLS
jgi:threonine/homoserine/homoserine lactone efflux protein